MMSSMSSMDMSKVLFDAQKKPQVHDLNAEDAKLREQTDAFEAILIKTLLDTSMKMNDVLYPKAPGHEIYQSMYKEHLSEALAGGFGYSDALFNWLKEEQNIAQNGGIYIPEDSKPKIQAGHKE